MELAREKCESHYITRAVRSLKKAKDASSVSLPIVSLLLAQAEASLGSIAKWQINVREEWFSWPPGFVSLIHTFCSFLHMHNLIP